MVKDDPRLVLLHRGTYHPTPLGSAPELWNNKILMFTGDVIGDQVPQAVLMPPLLLAPVPQGIKVANLAQQLLQFHANDTLQRLPAVSDDVPEDLCEIIKTRHAMYVPAELASLFLEGRLTPREALIATHSALVPIEGLDTFKPLVDWLRAAATEEGAAIIERAQPPATPLMDGILQGRLVRIVRQDLPDWNKLARPPQAETTARDSTRRRNLEDLVTEFLIQQQPQGSTGQVPARDKLPSEVWRGTIDLLLRLTQKGNEESLPHIWHAWAKCKKEERRAVLQDHFRKMARDLKLPEPVATVELTNLLYTLSFAAPFEDKLEYGVQPFAVAYLSQQSVAEQRELIDMHELLQDGAPSLTDILDLKAASKISMPTKESQMLRTLRAFGVVLAVAVGVTSDLYRAYKHEVIDAYEGIQPKLETLAEANPRELVYAQFLRWLQLRFQEYWTDAEVAVGQVDPPNFKMLVTAIRYKQWLRPEIPAGYFCKPKPRFLQPPDNGRVPGGWGSIPVPRAPRANPPAPAPASRHSYLRNANARSTLLNKGEALGKINVFLKVVGDGQIAAVPKNEQGKELCLAYHSKGGCYEDCARLQGHGVLSEDEADRLLDFIAKGLEKLAASAPTRA
jgi:hypothetical protein